MRVKRPIWTLLVLLILFPVGCRNVYRHRLAIEPDCPFLVTLKIDDSAGARELVLLWSVANMSSRTQKGCLGPSWEYKFGEPPHECSIEMLILHLGCRPGSNFQLRPAERYSWEESLTIDEDCGVESELFEATFEIVNRSSRAVWDVVWEESGHHR